MFITRELRIIVNCVHILVEVVREYLFYVLYDIY